MLWPRLALLSSVSAAGLLAAVPGHSGEIGCSGSNPATCNIAGGSYNQREYVFLTGAAGDDDVKTGGASDNLSVTNSGTFNLGSEISPFIIRAGITAATEGGVGQDEGGGGAGGAVSFTNNGTMTATLSTSSYPLFYLIEAISVGGEGDQDNKNDNSNGGTGGAGGTVTATNNSQLSVTGTVFDGMYGIFALSEGGRGGEQNSAVIDDQRGGTGGAGGSVTTTNNSSILSGNSSNRLQGIANGGGVVASSLGGSGGNYNGNAGSGGLATATNSGTVQIYWNAAAGGDRLLGIGALSAGGNGIESTDDSDNGGNGGSASTATVNNNGQILVDVTNGGSLVGAAMAAESRGGDGGKGPDKDQYGGDGGMGGSAVANLTGAGTLTTHGDSLYGILAESLGGQGGDASDGTALAGTGGGGGFGGNAGAVTVTTDAQTTITTTGTYAAGIAAHSIGGGGGTGSDFQSVLGGQGGNGGNGGNGGTVTVTTAGTISTSGDHAYGVLSQSIAGSGGTGGLATGEFVALGGDGAGGGTAGEAIVRNSGGITTGGYSSHGIIAQSVGGGGGAAGSATGLVSVGGDAAGTTDSDGGKVLINNTGTVTTAGKAAVGLIAQSVGGGGGSGGDSKGIAGVGGSGSAGGSGGEIDLINLGRIQTTGDFGLGVLAQSVGGGGGNGGDVLTVSTIASIGIGGNAANGGDGGTVCVDNTGAICSDGGGPAGQAATLTTAGNYAVGLMAQSIGGGGGNGGSVQNYSALSFVALQIGGKGGAGGAGNGVTVQQNDLAVTTGGAHAIGVLAQSVGGGGGNGGDASYYNVTVGFNASLVVGGSGGSGGGGGAAAVNLNNSRIMTGVPGPDVDPETYAPDDAFGIVAQSVGGGGGNGGSSSAADLVVAVPTGEGVSLAFNFQGAVGGTGGSGGAGGAASVTLNGGSSVTTVGDGSHAIVAQSVGGGGGNGGDASVLSTTLGDKNSVEVTAGMSLGGGGTSGSTGGTVTVTLGDSSGAVVGSPPALQLPPTQPTPASTIVTYGNYADGVLAQSIGGGGGNGGIGSSNAYSQGGVVSIKATVGVGGTGGSGGNGGAVNMTQYQNQTIQTLGSGSRGIVAQSIGGGGGNSQGGTLFLAAGAEGYEGRLSVGVGRTGGSGGDGGAVTANTDGAITTVGGDADGVMLQSIGGGGGLGGSIGADASSHPILDRIGEFKDNKDRLSDEGNTYTLTVDVGGTGGGGGNGGAVALTHSGRIATAGDWADGIVAQSIGGGGGAGGSSTASGSKVQANITVGVGGKGGSAATGGSVAAIFDDSHNNQIITTGYAANAVVLQSIGGGGGQGGDGSDQAAGNLTVGGDGGGTGGGGGNGGTVQINPLTDGRGSWLNAQTGGDDAIDILAQSIGGGGGTGGAGNSTAAKNVGGSAVAVVVGGKGGVSGSGEAVTLTTGLGLSTSGARAYGIVAQSIGGGGGIGGAGAANNLAGLALGGQGGAGGGGGAVTLDITTSSRITTRGAGAHAIVAQSIGGGGGIGGDASVGLFALNPTGRNGAGGSGGGTGGAVAVTVDGSIATSGANAFGILAQSIGGGGGFGGDQSGAFAGSTDATAAGDGGTVAVTQNGSIITTGANSTGIFAQSQGPEDNNTVTVTVNGAVTGGSGGGSGVWIAAGHDNVLTVNAGGSVSAASGTAIRYDGDYTTASGSLLTVNNYGTVSGNILLNNTDGPNAGTVNNYSDHTLIDASLYQADVMNQGRMVVGHSGTTDSTEITGNFTQGAAGSLVVDTDFNSSTADRLLVRGDAQLGGTLDLQATSLRPGRALTVLTVDGAATGAITPETSPIYGFALTPSGHDYRLSVASADFDADAMKLEGNQSKIARGLQDIWDAGGTDSFGKLFATLGAAADQGSSSYGNLLKDLSPGIALAPAQQLQAGMARFASGLMSCPVFSGTDALTGETDCAWAQVTGRSTQQTADAGTSGFSNDSITYQVGGQHEVAPGWFVGMSAAYQNSWLDAYDDRVDGNGDSGYVGLTVKREIGPWMVAGAISGSYGSFSLDRRIAVPGFEDTASSDPDVFAGSARLRVARTFAFSEMYLKPYVDLDAIYSRMPGYSENGGGDLGLKVEDSDQFTFAFSPSLEVGGRVDLDGAQLRPYAYAGVSILSDDDWTAKARFAGAPSGTGSFDTSLPIDDVVARIGAGVQVSTAAGFDIRLQYDGEFSDRVSSNSGSLRAIMPF
ncbi:MULTISPECIES: hypothetical protein [unclassified Inquilinus]|uniref:hypothetical protein n=1 Tax=unclassified Inquilinus TaxID=2645927 RepID=UPI003F92F31B